MIIFLFIFISVWIFWGGIALVSAATLIEMKDKKNKEAKEESR